MIEQWKTIEDFPRYAVSDRGNIKSISTGKILRSHDNRGYRRITLRHRDGSRRDALVHHLVLNTFLRQRRVNEQTDHKNNIKADNRLSNLEWVTSSINNKRRYDRGYLSCGRKLSMKQISEIRASKETERVLATQYNVGTSTISRIRRYEIYKEVS